MQAKKLLCRADGNASIGLGHLYRMLAIAGFYKEYFEIVFLTKQDSSLISISSAYPMQYIPNHVTLDEEPAWIANRFHSSEYIFIADGYSFDYNYQSKMKDHGVYLVYIDDLVKQNPVADVLINHSPGLTNNDYGNPLVTTLALGPSYAMLRDSFNRIAKKNRDLQQITNVFICFGGADPLNLTLHAAKAALRMDVLEEIHVVIGGAYKHTELFELNQVHTKLHIHQNLGENELLTVMESCQLGIAPASTILYELCSVKMVLISGFYVENQIKFYQALCETNSFIPAGDFTSYTATDFAHWIDKALHLPNKKELLENQKQLLDGRNKSRFLHLLHANLLSFKIADLEDMQVVYEWSNDPVVRTNSFHSNPIPWEEHKRWFEGKILATTSLFLIAFVNGKRAGIVRFEIGEDFATIGVLVSAPYRGQNLASLFIQKGANVYFKDNHLPILAYIKVENIGSVKSFEKAGFSLYKKEKQNNYDSFVYKLEKE